MAHQALSKKTIADFPVWKTITLGHYKSTAAYRRAFTKAKIILGEWADDILGQARFHFATERTDVDLVVASVADLGFNGRIATYSKICTRAKELGLELCPLEVGPALRLAYTDQPKGEWLLIAMGAIADSDGDLFVFRMGHGSNGLWLRGGNGRPDDFWRPDRRFIFVRPR
jgi:hypothetical protein